MAPKKPDKPKGSGTSQDAKLVLELTERAATEVDKLLKDNQSGTIGKQELNLALEELEQELKQMMVHVQRIL